MGNSSQIDFSQYTNSDTPAAHPGGGVDFSQYTSKEPRPEDQTFATVSPEQAYVNTHPGTVYKAADPAFPNRPAGIYPTGKGNEWRNDASYTQEPIDPDFAAHTAEYGLGSALVAGAAPTIAGAGLLGKTLAPNPAQGGLLEQEGPSLASQGLGKIKSLINNPTLQSAAKLAQATGLGLGGATAAYYGFKHWLDSTGGK
jgi:hypothetical protein